MNCDLCGYNFEGDHGNEGVYCKNCDDILYEFCEECDNKLKPLYTIRFEDEYDSSAHIGLVKIVGDVALTCFKFEKGWSYENYDMDENSVCCGRIVLKNVDPNIMFFDLRGKGFVPDCSSYTWRCSECDEITQTETG